MFGDQHLPLRLCAAEAANHPFAPVLHADPAAGATEGIGPAVDRVGQQVMDGVVDRQLPHDARPLGGRLDRRQPDPFLTQPEVNLPDALELGELAEHQAERLADPQVRVYGDAIVAGLDVADRHGEEQFAAPRLLAQSLQGTLAQDGQFHLAHRALHAQKKPVVGQLRVVHAVLIGQQAPHQAAELQQRVPVPAVAGEPRRLDGQHDDPAQAVSPDDADTLAAPGMEGGVDRYVLALISGSMSLPRREWARRRSRSSTRGRSTASLIAASPIPCCSCAQCARSGRTPRD